MRATAGRRGVPTAAAAVALLSTLGGCAATGSGRDAGPDAVRRPTATATPVETPSAAASPPSSQGPEGTPTADAELAADVLAGLPVKGRAPMTGYDRDRFGQAWLDADRNGCDTRNDVLGATLVSVQLRDGTNGCVVESGQLLDPYTGTTISYVYGDGFLVDIDHVVALGNAWATGAFAMDITKRAALANDPLNLLAVDAGENRSKGDGDAATWLPPRKAYRCAYVARQVAVKAKYDLWVTAAEAEAVSRVLAACPDQRLPPDSGARVAVDHAITDPGSTDPGSTDPGSTDPAAPQSAPPSGSDEPYYATCDEARADGAAPVRLGDPGYGAHLDGDGDGSACE